MFPVHSKSHRSTRLGAPDFVIASTWKCHILVTMKVWTHTDRVLDVSSLVGITAGMGLLLPALFVPDLRLLIVPALVVLLFSLLCCTR